VKRTPHVLVRSIPMRAQAPLAHPELLHDEPDRCASGADPLPTTAFST
jgi:hypothetical protein